MGNLAGWSISSIPCAGVYQVFYGLIVCAYSLTTISRNFFSLANAYPGFLCGLLIVLFSLGRLDSPINQVSTLRPFLGCMSFILAFVAAVSFVVLMSQLAIHGALQNMISASGGNGVSFHFHSGCRSLSLSRDVNLPALSLIATELLARLHLRQM